MVQFEIKVKREERCKCIEFHLPALSRELLTTQEIFQKMDISFFLFLHTFFWNLCRIRYRLAQILPQLRSKKLVSGVYHGIYHGGAPSVRGREGRGGSYERKWNFFLFCCSKIQSYFYLTMEEMKTFWPRSLSTTVLPYCANRNIIEIRRIRNGGKQFLGDESNDTFALLKEGKGWE